MSTNPRIALIFDNTLRPETTGVYCLRALQSLARVEFFTPAQVDQIPRSGFDFYLCIDDGLRYRLPNNLRPCAWWVIDTHMDLKWAIQHGQDFDWLFAAQKDGSKELENAGLSTEWLPLACDPTIHRPWDVENLWDICFVGNVSAGPRQLLLQRISAEFPRSFIGKSYFHEYAQTCSASSIGFNRSVKNDLNMRVFETLGCGPLLITNSLDENGQSELFESNQHLVTYSDESELFDKIRFHLRATSIRKKIAAKGHAEVIANHTYLHRMKRILSVCESHLNRVSVGVPHLSPFGSLNVQLRSEAPLRKSSEESRVSHRPSKDVPYFGHPRPEIVELIPQSARRLLDIGCGAGRMGDLLKQRQQVEVVGVELNSEAAEAARKVLDSVVQENVESDTLEFEVGHFDCIVCADVIEHLREPGIVLSKVHRWLSPNGTLIASIPNTRHFSVISGLLEGNWTYESAGLLDNDHVRFFTRREIEKLLFRHKFDIIKIISKPGPGYAEWVNAGRPGAVDVGALQIHGIPVDDAEEFFTYQFLVVAQPRRQIESVCTNASDNFSRALDRLREKHPWPVDKPTVSIPNENLGWFCEPARELLNSELKKPTQLVVELGSWLGMSTRYIADQAPSAQVIAVDHWLGSKEHWEKPQWANMLPTLYEAFQSLSWDYRDRITPLRMKTIDGLQSIADAGLNPDLIYVDADHSYDGVSADLEQCNRLFPDARIVGDDYEAPDVRRAATEFAERIGGMVEPFGTGWRAWRLIPPDKQQAYYAAAFEPTSIIIVTFNELSFTKECVNSIRLRTDEPYELIFVDNGSTDGTLEYLQSIPDARVILNSSNRGFPAAVNQGIEIAKGRQILLLNNDTVVSTSWLHKLSVALHADPEIGMTGPSSNNVSGPQMIQVSYSDMTSMDGFAWDWGKRYNGVREETDRLVGFCLLIKRDVLDQVGNLDEQFGIGCFEDDDICLRAIRAGWKAVIARDAFVHHYGSRTFIGSGVDCAGVLNENRKKYERKWMVRDSVDTQIISDSQFKLAEAPGGGLLLQTTRPRLSLCMIVRDNESTIRPCLESIRPWVDEMIIVDTGSTDATPQICEQLGAKVFHWAWRDDFSAARNQSLDHAAGEWLFWMDSDDTITAECGQRLRELADSEHLEGVFGYVMQVHCPGSSQDIELDVTAVDHVKLIRNRRDLRFEHRIHEQILPAIRRAGGEVAFTDIYVVHSGSDHSESGREKKLERDFKLLELDLKERPDHPFILFNFGMTYADAKRYEEAVSWLLNCLRVSSPQESHVRKAYALLVSSLYQQEKFQEAMDYCQIGRQHYPEDKELLFRQAMLNHQMTNLIEAENDYRKVLEPASERYFSSLDIGIAGFKARHNLALVLEDLGKTYEAKEQWHQILDEIPSYRPARIGIADCSIRLKEFEAAETLISSFESDIDSSSLADFYCLSSKLIESKRDKTQALRCLQRGIDALGNDPILLREQARILYELRDLKSAAEILQYLNLILPHDKAVQNNLTVVLRELS